MNYIDKKVLESWFNKFNIEIGTIKVQLDNFQSYLTHEIKQSKLSKEQAELFLDSIGCCDKIEIKGLEYFWVNDVHRKEFRLFRRDYSVDKLNNILLETVKWCKGDLGTGWYSVSGMRFKPSSTPWEAISNINMLRSTPASKTSYRQFHLDDIKAINGYTKKILNDIAEVRTKIVP